MVFAVTGCVNRVARPSAGAAAERLTLSQGVADPEAAVVGDADGVAGPVLDCRKPQLNIL